MQILRHAIARDCRIEVIGALQVSATLLIQTAIASESPSNLANAIRTEVETDAGVFVADGCRGAGALARVLIRANERHDEFVGDVFVVGLLHTLHWIGV